MLIRDFCTDMSLDVIRDTEDDIEIANKTLLSPIFFFGLPNADNYTLITYQKATRISWRFQQFFRETDHVIIDVSTVCTVHTVQLYPNFAAQQFKLITVVLKMLNLLADAADGLSQPYGLERCAILPDFVLEWHVSRARCLANTGSASCCV